MKLRHPSITRFGGYFVANFTRLWMGTLQYRAVYYDRTIDPALPEYYGPAIYLFWHEYIPFPFYLRGNCHVAMLLSHHQDAQFLAEAARHMGFQTIRGSTNRGGVAALRTMLNNKRTLNLAITPDGPRGPRRRLAQGCIYLSSRLGIPLVPFGIGYDRPWRVQNAWDNFAVPRPFSRARSVVGPRMQMPPGLSRDGVEEYRQRVEHMLNFLTTEAEQWASSREDRIGQRTVWRQGSPTKLAARDTINRAA